MLATEKRRNGLGIDGLEKRKGTILFGRRKRRSRIVRRGVGRGSGFNERVELERYALIANRCQCGCALLPEKRSEHLLLFVVRNSFQRDEGATNLGGVLGAHLPEDRF